MFDGAVWAVVITDYVKFYPLFPRNLEKLKINKFELFGIFISNFLF
jgi:hypothetical protein